MRLRIVNDPGSLRPETVAECRRQGYKPELERTLSYLPYLYASLLREWWRKGDGWLHCEQAVIPPPGSLDALRDCPHLACLHLHNCRRERMPHTLALCKFSTELLHSFPTLADEALAQRDWEVWWASHMLHAPRWHAFMAKPRNIENACMTPAAAATYGTTLNSRWPTTVAWPHMDTALWRAIERAGVVAHVHEPPAPHLRNADDNRVYGVLAESLICDPP